MAETANINRAWLVNSHISGVASEKELPVERRVEQLLVYRDELSAEIESVNERLRDLTRQQ